MWFLGGCLLLTFEVKVTFASVNHGVLFFFYFSIQISFDSLLFILLLSSFAKFRNATTSFVISVCPSVRPSFRKE